MKLFIFIFFLVTEVFYTRNVQTEECKKYVCVENLPDNTCIKDESENKVFIQRCLDDTKFCPFMSNKDGIVECVSRTGYHPRSFPGGECNKDSTCISGSCMDGICKGFENNEECSHHKDCYYGNACRTSETGSKSCRAQSLEGETCIDDYDCINTHGCVGEKCVEYLSLPDGATIKKSNGKSRNILPMCQSGFEYEEKCAQLINVGNNPIECNDNNTCKYQILGGAEVIIEEFCQCGKNPTGRKICRLGNGSKEFKDYINNLKILLAYSDNCNTLERGICSSHIKTNKSDIQKYMASSAKALRYNELAFADECVVATYFPEIAKNYEKAFRIYNNCQK